MALVDLAVNGLLDPDDLIDKLIAMHLEHIQGELVPGVDHPNEEESIRLDMLERQVLDLFIGESRVCNGDSSCWVGRRQLPGRVHADYVEEAPTMLHLLFAEFGEIVGHHVSL